MESLNSNSQERELHLLQQMQDKEKERCMERAKHKREYDRMMQSKEGNDDSSKALDAGLLRNAMRQNQKGMFQAADSGKIHMLRMQISTP
ncbi:hypothetical protein Tco_0020113 [Tanacetum coccineum]